MLVRVAEIQIPNLVIDPTTHQLENRLNYYVGAVVEI
jgi:hypothetical protein